jgi:hypothetical protein
MPTHGAPRGAVPATTVLWVLLKEIRYHDPIEPPPIRPVATRIRRHRGICPRRRPPADRASPRPRSGEIALREPDGV